MMSLILAGMCVLGESTRDSCISRAKRGEVNVVLGLLRNQLLCLNSVSFLVQSLYDLSVGIHLIPSLSKSLSEGDNLE